MMTCINVAEFVLISYFEKDRIMIERRRLKNVVIFIQAILSFVNLFSLYKNSRSSHLIKVLNTYRKTTVLKYT